MYLSVSPYQEVLEGISTSLQINEGIIKLTGRPGAGKSALCAQLLRQLEVAGHQAIYFPNAPKSAEQMQAEILAFLGLDGQGNFTKRLSSYLQSREDGQRLLYLIFNDAQNIDHQTMNAIRMLCNVQDEQHALVRPIICGTEKLDQKLGDRSYRSVAQYLSETFKLPAMDQEQLKDFYWAYFVHHGIEIQPPKSKEIASLFRETMGLPGPALEKLQQIHARLTDAPLPEPKSDGKAARKAARKPEPARAVEEAGEEDESRGFTLLGPLLSGCLLLVVGGLALFQFRDTLPFDLKPPAFVAGLLDRERQPPESSSDTQPVAPTQSAATLVATAATESPEPSPGPDEPTAPETAARPETGAAPETALPTEHASDPSPGQTALADTALRESAETNEAIAEAADEGADTNSAPGTVESDATVTAVTESPSPDPSGDTPLTAAEAPVAALAETGDDEPASAETDSADPGPAEEPPAPQRADSIVASNSVLRVLNWFLGNWVEAWEQRDAGRYLSYYDADFSTPEAGGAEQWRSKRRAELDAARELEIAYEDLRVHALSSESITVSFLLRYSSASGAYARWQELRLRFVPGGFSIAAERTLPPATAEL